MRRFLILFAIIYVSAEALTIKDIQYTTDPSGASPYQGQTVTVYGVVTAGNEEYVRTPLSNGFFIQDSTGPWHGILVYTTSYDVKRGDSVRVTGTVQEYYGRTEINASSVTILAHRREIPGPYSVTTGEIRTGASTAESFEGVLVRVTDAWVVNPDLGYGEWSISDGSGAVRVDDAANYYYTPQMGDTFRYLVGVLDYSFSNFKIEPRRRGDLLLTSEPNIQVYFNRSVKTDVALYEPATGNVQLDELLAEYIGRANYSIDFCVYSLSRWCVVDSLISAYERGVKVRVIVEHDNLNSYIDSLSNAGIPVIDDAYGYYNSGNYSMHNKFLVVDFRDSTFTDDDFIWTGSYNPSYYGTFYNANNVVIVRDTGVARAYTLEFEEMWGSRTESPSYYGSRFGPRKYDNTPHHFVVDGHDIYVYFSPADSSKAHLVEQVNDADRSIYFCIYSFTNQDISDAMKGRWDSGDVMVAAVFDSLFWLDSGHNSESWDLSGLGGGNPWDPPAYVYVDSLSGGGILHHKYMLIDRLGDDPTVITGSMNWTYYGDRYNDENIIVIKDPVTVDQFYQEFAARYEEAGGTLPPGFYDIDVIQSTMTNGDSTAFCGKRIATTGIVTGIFGNDFYIEMSDASDWSGILVYRNGTSQPSVSVGDSLYVMGIAAEYGRNTEIKSITGRVDVISSPGAPDPQAISLSELGESKEGLLVEFENVQFLESGTFSSGGTYHVVSGDGADTAVVYIKSSTNIPGTSIPSGLITLVGIIQQYYGTYEILPRSTGDFITGVCGDVNGDGEVTSADVVYLAGYLYSGGNPPLSSWAADVTGDGEVNVTDLVVLANYLYAGGPPPSCQ